MTKLKRAIEFAVAAHAGQLRKDDLIPYVVHPIEVMKHVRDWGVKDEEILAAAVLHDCIEDTSATLEVLEGLFGPTVRSLVDELTFTSDMDKSKYIAGFRHASIGAFIIKAADRICNVRDFLQSDRLYAAKYLAKAAELPKIAEERWMELQYYNILLASRIKLDFDKLGDCC